MAYAPDSAVRWLVQHYSATYIESEYTYERLERDHKARGFREGGYHFYITYPRPGKPARIITGRDLTQPGRFETGAHSQGENGESIGVCLEGGLTKATGPDKGIDTRHPDQIALQIQLIDDLMERFPGAIVEGHRDMPGAATQCPGYGARAWWDGVLRARISTGPESLSRPPAATVPAQVPKEVMDLIDECDGQGSKTDLFNGLLKWLSGGGGAALLAKAGDLDWRIVAVGMVCATIVFGVAFYSQRSRGRKALKALRAAHKLGVAT